MANLRRRSARLSKANSTQSSARKTPASTTQLGSLVERDETPDAGPESIDAVLSTPTTSRTAHDRLAELSALKTPRTEPKPEKAEMDPKTAHRSTAKAPDSGLKLGFSDIKKDKTYDTPSKSAPRQSVPTSSTFEFKFSSDSHLSKDAQKLMENVRDDAARIKAQMMAERAAQEHKDQAAENMFGASRKIAQPKGKAGRFSDVHMAQFKKMDSIENHASSFRARPGFAAPTAQSLKRSPSKAGLDELERSQTAGKSTPGQLRRIPPPVTGRPVSVSPFKTIPATQSRTTQGPSKRARQSERQDVSDSRPTSSLPQPKSSTSYSPTKSSTAHTSESSTSPEKPSMIPRANSVKSTKASEPTVVVPRSPSKLPVSKPLPSLPTEPIQSTYPSLPTSPAKSTSDVAHEGKFTSKLPTLSGLRSILRGNRNAPVAVQRPGTPKRPNTADAGSDSPRKVDFTPSVKSRYAVKLAATSPSPAKVRRDTPYKVVEPVTLYDSSAWIIEDNGVYEQEDDEGRVSYPTLPLADEETPVNHTFNAKARELNRRESKEFKSIFTNLHPSQKSEPATLTSINTMVNKTNPEMHANHIMRSPSNTQIRPSPRSIRRVRGSSSTELVQPFEDKSSTTSGGNLGKKRRYESVKEDQQYSTDEETKENRRVSTLPAVPGAWTESVDDDADQEGTSRAGKRARVSTVKPAAEKRTMKKPNAAREAAAKNAKERKGRGVLSLSRLNVLSRPKSRG